MSKPAALKLFYILNKKADFHALRIRLPTLNSNSKEKGKRENKSKCSLSRSYQIHFWYGKIFS